MANGPKAPYSAVIIELKTPLGDFTTSAIDLTDPENVRQVEGMLRDLESKHQMRFPLSDDSIILVPQDVLMNSVYKLRYIK